MKDCSSEGMDGPSQYIRVVEVAYMENVSERLTLVSPTYKMMLDVERINDIDSLLRKSDVTRKGLKGDHAMKGGTRNIPNSVQLNLKFARTYASKKGWLEGSKRREMCSNPCIRLDLAFGQPFIVEKGRQVLMADLKRSLQGLICHELLAVERDNSNGVKGWLKWN